MSVPATPSAASGAAAGDTNPFNAAAGAAEQASAAASAAASALSRGAASLFRRFVENRMIAEKDPTPKKTACDSRAPKEWSWVLFSKLMERHFNFRESQDKGGVTDDPEDTMGNLRKTFAGVFGDM